MFWFTSLLFLFWDFHCLIPKKRQTSFSLVYGCWFLKKYLISWMGFARLAWSTIRSGVLQLYFFCIVLYVFHIYMFYLQNRHSYASFTNHWISQAGWYTVQVGYEFISHRRVMFQFSSYYVQAIFDGLNRPVRFVNQSAPAQVLFIKRGRPGFGHFKVPKADTGHKRAAFCCYVFFDTSLLVLKFNKFKLASMKKGTCNQVNRFQTSNQHINKSLIGCSLEN